MPPRTRFLFAAIAYLVCSWIPTGESACAAQPPKQPPPRLDAYGDPLPDQALLRLGTVRLRDAAGVWALVFSPDGKALASASGDDSIRLWDPSSGREIRRFEAHQSTVVSLAFSPNGQWLLSGGWDQTVRMWDVHTGKELARFLGQNTAVVAFSPDGKTIAAAASEVEFRDADTWNPLQTFTDYGRESKVIKSLAFAPDGKTLAIGHREGIQLLEPATGKKGLSLECETTVSLFFSPDGKTLISGHQWAANKINAETHDVTGGYDGIVRLWDAATGKKIKEWQWPSTGITELALSSDGKQLAAGADDNSILIWESATGKPLGRLKGCRDQPRYLAFSPDGKTLAAATSGGPVIHFWDLPTGKLHNSPHQGVPSLALSPTSRLLATTDAGCEVFLWDVPSGRALPPLTAAQGVAFCIGFAPDGKRLLWGDKYADKEKPLTTIRVWCVAERKQILTWQSAEFMESVTLSPDGRWLASTGSAIRLWNAETGKEQMAFTGPNSQFPVAFSPDSKILAAAFHDALRWWDVNSGKEIGSLQMNWNPLNKLHLFFATARSAFVGNLNITHIYDLVNKNKTLAVNSEGKGFWGVCLAPDGKTLVTMSPGEGGFRFWDFPAAKVVSQVDLKGLQGALPKFSPDGRNLLVMNGETISLVEAATGQERHRFEGLARHLHSAEILASGKYLITTNSDTTALVWNLMQPFTGEYRPATVGPKELAQFWDYLDSQNANKAYRAIRYMVPAGDETLTFLKEHLKPVVPADPDRVAKLIADLDNQSYKVRQSASKDLEELGFLAEPTLRQALASRPTLEMRLRVESLLRKLPDWLQNSDNLRILRALEVVELIGTPEAQEFLRALSNGAPFARLTIEAKGALARLELQH